MVVFLCFWPSLTKYSVYKALEYKIDGKLWISSIVHIAGTAHANALSNVCVCVLSSDS